MMRAIKYLNVFGLIVGLLYLVAALLTGPKFSVGSGDKDEALSRIENTSNGKDASLVARPFFSVMINVINSAKVSLLVSCGVVFFNGAVFLLNVLAIRELTGETGSSGSR